jgi:excisionase family DNA binding protein
MSPEPARRILTIAQACAEVGVSRRSIYNWLAAGKLEFCRTPGGTVRIYADALTRPGSAAEFSGASAQPAEPPINAAPAAVSSPVVVWEETPGYREHCEQRWREARKAPRG